MSVNIRFVTLLCALVAGAAFAADTSSLIVQTGSGPVRGFSADGMHIGQTVKVSHPDPESRRKILAFAALDMLRRHMLGEPVLGDYLTLARTAQRS